MVRAAHRHFDIREHRDNHAHPQYHIENTVDR